MMRGVRPPLLPPPLALYLLLCLSCASPPPNPPSSSPAPPPSVRTSPLPLPRYRSRAAAEPSPEGGHGLRLRGGGRGFRDLNKASSLTGWGQRHEKSVHNGEVTKKKRRKWWQYTFKPRAPKVVPVLHAVDSSGCKEPLDWDSPEALRLGFGDAGALEARELVGGGGGGTELAVAGHASLLRCARFDDARGVRSLIKKGGVDVNVRDPDTCGGGTALHIAAGQGHIGPVKRLLKYGADPNAQTQDGHTPVHWAASMGHGDVVERLVRGGAKLGVATRGRGITPLQTALANGYPRVAQMIRDMLGIRGRALK